MAINSNIDTGIFSPVTQDYGVISLERVFGPIVRAAADKTDLNNLPQVSSMLEQLITILNLASLFFGAIVLGYTLYSTILDTAADGESMGRSTNPRYTILRTVIGIVLLIPIKGGFTIVQCVVIYLLVWGSGLADTAWTKIAESNLSNVNYISPSKFLGNGSAGLSPAVSKNFANALRARTAGYICQHYLNDMSSTMKLDGRINALSAKVVNEYSGEQGYAGDFYSSTVWAFSDDKGNYSYSGNVCGSVVIPTFKYTLSASAVDKEVDNFTNTYNQIARDASYQALVSATNLMDQYAKRLAEHIVNNPQDEKWDKQLISEAVVKISEQFSREYIKAIASYAQQNDYSKSLLTMATRNGWVFAANWQRMMSNVYIKTKSGLEDVDIKASMPKQASAIFGITYFSKSATVATFFKQYRNQMIYFDSLESAFDAAAMNKDVFTNGQMQFENGSSIMSWMADSVMYVLGKTEPSNVWSDPLVEIQDVGTVFLTSAIAAKAALSVGSFFPNPAIKIVDSFISPVINVLIVIGVGLAILIPYVPIVYYIGAVIGWILLSVEAIFAAPISVIMCFSPQRQESLIGSNHNVILTLFGVLLRPFFILTGLIASYVIMRVGIDMINVLFSGIVKVMAPEGTISSIYLFIGTIIVYGFLIIAVVLHCCRLITGLSDYVLGWIGVGISSLSKANPFETMEANFGLQNRIPAMRTSSFLKGHRVGQFSKNNNDFKDG